MTEKRSALIIASYQYGDADLRQLVAPAQDAGALARVLQAPTIGGFEVQTLLNEPSHKVRQEIDAFFTDPQRKRDDLLLLYFSGHGIKDEDGRLYFATPDTQRRLLRSTAVSANFVNSVMLQSRPRRQVLLLDCCYSGAFARGMLAKSDPWVGTKEQFEGRGRIVLTASDAMQYAFEGDQVFGSGVRSVFTHNLVQGLESGEADTDGDGDITLDELYEYVYNRIVGETPQQRPEKWDLGVQGKIIIARNPNPVVKPAELPRELQEAIESPLAEVRTGAVRELDRLLHGTNKGLALAANIALTELADDDSRRVSTLARESIGAYAEPPSVPVEEAEPMSENLAARKEEREYAAIGKAEAGRPGWFLWVGGLGAIVGIIVGIFAVAYGTALGPPLATVFGGAMQRFVLRRQIRQTGWWEPTSKMDKGWRWFAAGALGVVLGVVGGVLFLMLLISPVLTISYLTVDVLVIASSGAIGGAISGFVLAWLFRHPNPDA